MAFMAAPTPFSRQWRAAWPTASARIGVDSAWEVEWGEIAPRWRAWPQEASRRGEAAAIVGVYRDVHEPWRADALHHEGGPTATTSTAARPRPAAAKACVEQGHAQDADWSQEARSGTAVGNSPGPPVR